MTATSLFEQVGPDRFQATELARGPWDPNALHGGPPSALVAGALARAMDAADLGVTWFPSRFTGELLRPVPLDELTVQTEIRRPGRRICVADGRLVGPDGKVCLSATLSAIRDQPFARPIDDEPDRPKPQEQGMAARMSGATGDVMFARDSVEHRVVAGRFEAAGPATDWMRVTVPMVDGRALTPLERVIALADFGNGVSKWFDMAEVLFLNPDLTVHLHRLPVGEWVCLQAASRLGPHGVGMAESLLFDEDGPIGRSVQSLLVEER